MRDDSIDTTDFIADVSFECPRCQSEVSERLYGPCEECRTKLRSEVHGTAANAKAVEYEPKMNVTPNAVALKDD